MFGNYFLIVTKGCMGCLDFEGVVMGVLEACVITALVTCFCLMPPSMATNDHAPNVDSDLHHRVRDVYAREAKLVEAAWGFSLSDGSPLRPSLDPVSPLPHPTESAVNATVSRPASKHVNEKHRYRFAADYDFKHDPQWKRGSAEVEKQFQILIAEFLRKEGPQSRTAAKLKDHLAGLYYYSGDGNSDDLHRQARLVLFPTCPRCHKNDSVSMMSPPPNATIEEVLKDGWWSCQRCDQAIGQHPFRARGAQAR
jgi:hypothetical protein